MPVKKSAQEAKPKPEKRNYWRARVLFSSGHTEHIEYDSKGVPVVSIPAGVTNQVHAHIKKYLDIDPATYTRPYYVLSCICYEGPAKGHDLYGRASEARVIAALKANPECDTYQLRHDASWSRAFLMKFLEALQKHGSVEFKSESWMVVWTGER